MKSLCFCLFLISLIKVNSIELNCDELLVTLFVYSSRDNPQWTIRSTQFNVSQQQQQFDFKETNQIMGYQGFSIRCPSNGNEMFINGNSFLEQILLETGKSFLSKELVEHIRPFLGKKSSLNILSKSISKTANCDRVPIKGPDSVPIYNPLTDNGGCFITRQSRNNCYAYATDIVTNTFPQPGRWHGKSPLSITCESIRQASIRDGLVYKGFTLNESQPKLGHYLALFIWSNLDYHWVRKDANGLWSHKPGPGRVTNRDNRGLFINNPLKSNFTPWTTFCGFYVAQPSKINIR